MGVYVYQSHLHGGDFEKSDTVVLSFIAAAPTVPTVVVRRSEFNIRRILTADKVVRSYCTKFDKH